MGRARAAIAALQLDLLLYLDLTMSTMGTRLAMSRLARVQLISHGHPTTSGIDRDSMDYCLRRSGSNAQDSPVRGLHTPMDT
jgi:hypothetical protein